MYRAEQAFDKRPVIVRLKRHVSYWPDPMLGTNFTARFPRLRR